MFESNCFKEINVDYLKDAIKNGISSEAVVSSLKDIIDKSNTFGKTPKQLTIVMHTLAFIKSDIIDNENLQYKSNTFKRYSKKIKSALNDGLSSSEITESLNKMANKRTKGLMFMTKLIVRMEAKELSLRKQNVDQKTYQKVLTQ